MIGQFWQSLRSMAAESPVVEKAALDMCDMAVTGMDRIRELLQLLAQNQFGVALQSESGQDLGAAKVYALAGEHVVLQRPDQAAALDTLATHRVNAVGSTRQGALMFTLDLTASRLWGLWRAPFPKELLCVQSRAYRRVHVPSSMGHQARLAAPGVFQDARVLDLAEEGAGLQVAEPGLEQAMSKAGILTLDGLELRVPNIRVVHQLQRGDGQTRLGVALHGMLEADRRALRRWLNAAEVTSLARS